MKPLFRIVFVFSLLFQYFACSTMPAEQNLFVSIVKNDVSEVKNAIRERTNTYCNYGGSGWPLMVSMSKNVKAEITKIFIDNKSDVNFKDSSGTTPLMMAVRFKNNPDSIEKAKMLITAGANVNETDIFGQTALIIAAENRNNEGVELLMKAKADINIKDIKSGASALDYAVSQNNIALVKMLSDANAIPDIVIINEAKIINRRLP